MHACACVCSVSLEDPNKATLHWLLKIATAVICVAHQTCLVPVPGTGRTSTSPQTWKEVWPCDYIWMNGIYATSVLEDWESIICSFFFSLSWVMAMLLMAAALSSSVPANPWWMCQISMSHCSFQPLRCGGCLLSQQNLTDPIIQVKEILFKTWTMKKT